MGEAVLFSGQSQAPPPSDPTPCASPAAWGKILGSAPALPGAQRGHRASGRLCMVPVPGLREGSGTRWTGWWLHGIMDVHTPRDSYVLTTVHFLSCELHL